MPVRTLGAADSEGVASGRDTARRARPGQRRQEARRAAGGAGGRRRWDLRASGRGAEGAPGGGAARPDRGIRRGGGEDVAAVAAPRLGRDSEVHPGAK